MTKRLLRRNFLRTIPLATGGMLTALQSCQPTPEKTNPKDVHINFNKTYQWRLVTTWPPKFPVFGEGLEQMSQWIAKASAGRMQIKVFGANELVPALECFDAVSQGAAQMASSVSYYWAGKIPAVQFFSAIPFGMNAQQMNAWLINGGGLKLWEELYAPHNLIPFPAGNTGVQMGGWFRKELKSVADLQGLKIRMPGLGGKAMTKAGATALLSPANELYTNLERGVIDAAEWIGPYHDYVMGFYSVAKYYYYPGWHEPGPTLEMFVNKSQFETLPTDLQEIIRTAIYRLSIWTLGEFEAKNNLYLDKLVREEGVLLRKYPDEVLNLLRKTTQEVIDELISVDKPSKKVYESFKAFKKQIVPWSKITEQVFYDTML
ncbi:MAG TPA: ABC transporter substrate-binding protein [Microscillaceae bacterium]|nr:ABC transporter substrate-binding protein [Microscillaceae bacterium]